MPIYEYVCRSCGHPFEELVQSDTKVACPTCKHEDVERTLSAFAVGKGGREAQVPVGCGNCGDPRGPGACMRS